MSNNGIGLLIHGKLCGEERFGMVNCGNLGARVITYDLIDVAGYKKQIKDGEAALLAKQQAEISKQKF